MQCHWKSVGGGGGVQTFGMKLNWNFLGGGGGERVQNKKPSVGGGGGMDIFWNYNFVIVRQH